jgi:hypothetical protein
MYYGEVSPGGRGVSPMRGAGNSLWALGAVGSAYANMRGFEAYPGAGSGHLPGGHAMPHGLANLDEYGRAGAMQPLAPGLNGLVIDGILHPHVGGEETRGRFLEANRGRRTSRARSGASLSPSGGRRSSPRKRSQRGKGDVDGEDEDEGENDEEEIARRVESIEEELRVLAESKRERDAQVQEQMHLAISLAHRIGEGRFCFAL